MGLIRNLLSYSIGMVVTGFAAFRILHDYTPVVCVDTSRISEHTAMELLHSASKGSCSKNGADSSYRELIAVGSDPAVKKGSKNLLERNPLNPSYTSKEKKNPQPYTLNRQRRHGCVLCFHFFNYRSGPQASKKNDLNPLKSDAADCRTCYGISMQQTWVPWRHSSTN